jgi:transglutaminase-like putative cysteine protease
MTATGTPFDLGASYTAARVVEPPRRLALAEGWSSVLLLAFMAAIVGWAIDDAHWVLGDQAYTDFLPWAGILGVLAGTAGALLGRGRLVAHGLGAIAATVFIVWAIAGQLAPESDVGMFTVVGERVWGAWDDLVIRRRATTTEVAHFILVLGIIVWGTAQFASYALFAHHRALAAVVIPGTVLFVNVAITARPQFALLVLYTAAALLVLVRAHVAEEERTWARHRIADVGNAVGLSVRAGLAFVALALVVSLGLTSVASSNPLAGAWGGVGERLVDVGRELARLFPAGGPTRFGGASFGSTISITGEWISDDTPVLSITSDPLAPRRKWRAVAYDRFTGSQWSRSAEGEIPVASGEPLLAGTSDAPLDGVAVEEVEYVVRAIGGAPGQMLAPGAPLRLDADATVRVIPAGPEAWFGEIRVSGDPVYTAAAAIPILDPDVEGALTEGRLRAAGTAYPPDLVATYTRLEPGTAGAEVRELVATVMAAENPQNPYDTARAFEAYLRSSGEFQYDTNVLDVECGDLGVADCFAVSRRGYCEHFATTMVVMLRVQGIPARLVEGYLPGSRDAAGEQTIRRSQAHAWVELWFPGIGWVDFDPTANVGQPEIIPAGEPVPTPTPLPSGAVPGSPRPSERADIDEPDGPAGGGGYVPPRQPGIGPLVIVVLPLAALALVLGVTWLRRRLGRPTQPEVVYRTVASLAGRLGHPRRPTQTVYEYLGTLSDAVPTARPELQLVAQSTVETTYGRRRLPPDRLAALGEAQRRLRFALLRLLVRRPGRRG